MRRFAITALGLAFLVAPPLSRADSADYGHNSQQEGGLPADDYDGALVTPDANGNPRAPTACAPTATVNSFEMLQNVYGVTGLVDETDPYDAINELADDMGTQGDSFYNPASPNYHTRHTGGTSAQGLVNGKVEYIEANQTGGPEIEVHGQGIFGTFNNDGTVNSGANGVDTIPTDEFLQQQIADGQDVEVWESWVDADGVLGHNGAHIITITGIDSEAGTINFVDPWDGVDVDATFQIEDTEVQNGTIDGNPVGVSGNFMRITYPAPDDGGDDPENPDDPADEMSADISMVVAESPVPEPATLALLVIGTGMLALRRRQLTTI